MKAVKSSSDKVREGGRVDKWIQIKNADSYTQGISTSNGITDERNNRITDERWRCYLRDCIPLKSLTGLLPSGFMWTCYWIFLVELVLKYWKCKTQHVLT